MGVVVVAPPIVVGLSLVVWSGTTVVTKTCTLGDAWLMLPCPGEIPTSMLAERISGVPGGPSVTSPLPRLGCLEKNLSRLGSALEKLLCKSVKFWLIEWVNSMNS